MACPTVALSFFPKRMIIGAVLFDAPDLHSATAARMRHRLRGYMAYERFNRYSHIVPPGLGGQAGLTGALLLAEDALNRA